MEKRKHCDVAKVVIILFTFLRHYCKKAPDDLEEVVCDIEFHSKLHQSSKLTRKNVGFRNFAFTDYSVNEAGPLCKVPSLCHFVL